MDIRNASFAHVAPVGLYVSDAVDAQDVAVIATTERMWGITVDELAGWVASINTYRTYVEGTWRLLIRLHGHMPGQTHTSSVGPMALKVLDAFCAVQKEAKQWVLAVRDAERAVLVVVDTKTGDASSGPAIPAGCVAEWYPLRPLNAVLH